MGRFFAEELARPLGLDFHIGLPPEIPARRLATMMPLSMGRALRALPSAPFADPDAQLGYAYVMNKTEFYMFDDPREKALRDAIYRAIARLGPAVQRYRSFRQGYAVIE